MYIYLQGSANICESGAPPTLTDNPEEGHFYQIKKGDNLLHITSRAYGVKAGQERLKLARRINDDPFNLRLRRPKPVNLFPEGIISLFPEFADPSTQLKTKGKPPSGGEYAVIKIPCRSGPSHIHIDEPLVVIGDRPKPDKPRPKKPVKLTHLPAIVNCSFIANSDVSDKLIRVAWLEAKARVAHARMRLGELAAIDSEAVRRDEWNKGDERIWFGHYKSANFAKIHRNFNRIWAVLTSDKLEIRCEGRKSCIWMPNCCKNCCGSNCKGCSWGSARWNSFRAAQITIILRDVWFHCRKQNERVQTLIHEAAHISGVSSARESKKAGPSCAKQLALRNCFQAAKNADNYGYYAMASENDFKKAKASACTHFFAKRPC